MEIVVVLPGAVGAEQPVGLARRDRESDAVDGDPVAERLAEPLALEYDGWLQGVTLAQVIAARSRVLAFANRAHSTSEPQHLTCRCSLECDAGNEYLHSAQLGLLAKQVLYQLSYVPLLTCDNRPGQRRER